MVSEIRGDKDKDLEAQDKVKTEGRERKGKDLGDEDKEVEELSS